MITFLLDASALARHYFHDVGTSNVEQLLAYPNSIVAFPTIARVEVVSATVAAYNGGLLDERQLDFAVNTFVRDIQLKENWVEVELAPQHFSQGIELLKRHKLVPRGTIGTGKASLGGADALYLAVALELSHELRKDSDRLILITSDRALYNAALDEPDVETFHFWTCQCPTCGDTHIPEKGRRNVCPHCGRVCDVCARGTCESVFTVSFS